MEPRLAVVKMNRMDFFDQILGIKEWHLKPQRNPLEPFQVFFYGWLRSSNFVGWVDVDKPTAMSKTDGMSPIEMWYGRVFN